MLPRVIWNSSSVLYGLVWKPCSLAFTIIPCEYLPTSAPYCPSAFLAAGVQPEPAGRVLVESTGDRRRVVGGAPRDREVRGGARALPLARVRRAVRAGPRAHHIVVLRDPLRPRVLLGLEVERDRDARHAERGDEEESGERELASARPAASAAGLTDPGRHEAPAGHDIDAKVGVRVLAVCRATTQTHVFF